MTQKVYQVGQLFGRVLMLTESKIANKALNRDFFNPVDRKKSFAFLFQPD